MKRILYTVILTCIFLTACRHRETYRFLHVEEDISSISIVTFLMQETGEIIETELKEIEDENTFLAKFRAVDCYTYFGDPTGLTEPGMEDIVIKITYGNGEYELINWNGQAEYTLQKGFNFYAGYSVFDEKEFEALVGSILE